MSNSFAAYEPAQMVMPISFTIKRGEYLCLMVGLPPDTRHLALKIDSIEGFVFSELNSILTIYVRRSREPYIFHVPTGLQGYLTILASLEGEDSIDTSFKPGQK